MVGGLGGAIGAAASLAGGLLGGGGQSGTPAKLTITPLSSEPAYQPLTDQAIEVLFNPISYSIVKPVGWSVPTPSTTSTAKTDQTTRSLNAPTITFTGGGSRTMTLNLFFDVTEPVERNGNKTLVADVREETKKIVQLTRIQRGTGSPLPPPVCQISWGDTSGQKGFDFPFYGVITNLTQNFTLFRRDGKPVRAELTVAFQEFALPEQDQRNIDPELTTHIIRRGDTLSSLAAHYYRNPNLWRIIAEENQLDDPRDLSLWIGRRLRIPKSQ